MTNPAVFFCSGVLDKYVPCLCYLCNGKLVSRYIRQKHAKVCGSRKANQQPNSDCQRVTMFREQVVDEHVGEPDGDEHDRETDGDEGNDVISDDNQLSHEQEVCNSLHRL